MSSEDHGFFDHNPGFGVFDFNKDGHADPTEIGAATFFAATAFHQVNEMHKEEEAKKNRLYGTDSETESIFASLDIYPDEDEENEGEDDEDGISYDIEDYAEDEFDTDEDSDSDDWWETDSDEGIAKRRANSKKYKKLDFCSLADQNTSEEILEILNKLTDFSEDPDENSAEIWKLISNLIKINDGLSMSVNMLILEKGSKALKKAANLSL